MTKINLLRILFVEDLNSDVDLAVLELKKENLKFEYYTVCTMADLIRSLKNFKPDLIISDFMMPSFNGLQALEQVKKFNSEIPFILCTGSVNEETAVKCIQAGADDYIIKEHLTRLPYAVKEVLEKNLKEKEKKAAELLLKENEEKLQSIFRAAPVGIGLVVNRIFIEINDTFCTMTGYTRKELIGKSVEMIYATKDEFERVGIDKYGQITEKGTGSVETRFKCQDGRIINVLISSTPLDINDLTKGVTFITLDITDRFKLEEARRKSEEQFRTLYNEAVVGLYRTSPRGEILRANLALVKMLGFQSFEELSARNLKDTGFGPLYRRQEFIEKIDKEGEIKNLEAIWISRDGKEILVRESSKKICDSKGVILYYDGTVEDISESKRAAEAFNKIQHLFETLLMVSPVGIFRTDPEGNTTYVNPKWSELSGLSLEEALENGWFNAVHPEDRVKLSDGWLKNIRNNTESDAEYRFLKPDGSVKWVMGRAVPEYFGNEVVGYIGSITDITDRKIVEEELKKNQSQLINAHLIAHLGSWEYDVENDTFIFNDPFYAIFRTTAEQVGGYTMKSADYTKRFVHPDDIALVGSETRKAIETDYPDFSRQLEHRIIYDDGETGYVIVRFFVVKNEKGKTVRTYGVSQDITERKRVEAELEKIAVLMKLAKEKAEANDKLKTNFLNNISHEVRTPLNGILGFAEIMSQTILTEEEKRVSFSMLFESSDRLLNTITNYMDISLINSGTMSLYKKDFLPGQILKELYTLFQIKCSARNLELLLEIPEQSEKLMIYSDPELLRKILTHLLNNAIKFTEKGIIRFGYTYHKAELEFFISDTGIGIGNESLDKVFEHFVKEDRGPLRLSDGSGLGLSISKGLAELLGGKLRVESEKSIGSTFFFTIPVEREIENNILRPVKRKQKENKKTCSILVAEDDLVNFYYLRTLLKKHTSAEIIHASNGKEAVEQFMQNPNIDLILMDIKMPVMDGLEATRQIKAVNQNVPVIAITAYAMTGDESRILDAGCDYYLIKPVNKKLLLEKMAEYNVI